jgi:hypothetical protein
VPQACTVCTHPASLVNTEALVVEKRSNRATAGQYNLSRESVRRHREHIPELLVKASQAIEEEQQKPASRPWWRRMFGA